ncbi:hypothetical protein BGW80DRAFT_715867 [Lactifluus volemus]|nr:hypothetical protein BGW80DRAFT_715867 [Lactifluus volemus]
MLPDLVLDHFESRDPPGERELGDDFAFTSALLQLRMELSNVESTDVTPYTFFHQSQHFLSLHINAVRPVTANNFGQFHRRFYRAMSNSDLWYCHLRDTLSAESRRRKHFYVEPGELTPKLGILRDTSQRRFVPIRVAIHLSGVASSCGLVSQ